MQQTPLEGCLQGASHLDSDVQHVELRKGFLRLDPAVQTPSISNLHRQESQALVVVEGEDVDDVGVIDLGAGPGLHGEVVHGGRIFGKLAPHQLYSHLATEGGIPGAIDRTHTARGDLRAQFILSEHHGHHH